VSQGLSARLKRRAQRTDDNLRFARATDGFKGTDNSDGERPAWEGLVKRAEERLSRLEARGRTS